MRVHKSVLVQLLAAMEPKTDAISTCLAAIAVDPRPELESTSAPAKELLMTYRIKLQAAERAGVKADGTGELLDRLAHPVADTVLIFAITDGTNNYGLFTNEDLSAIVGRYQIPVPN